MESRDHEDPLRRDDAASDFDVLAWLSDKDAQLLLRETEAAVLVNALIGAPSVVREKLLRNVSEMVRDFVESEMRFVRYPQPEGARHSLLVRARALAEQGQLTWPQVAAAPAPRAATILHIESELADLALQPVQGLSDDGVIQLMQGLTELARREGILALEPLLQGRETSLVREGIQLLIDGFERDLIFDLLETRAQTILREREQIGQMIVEGILSIMAGDNPAIVRYKLEAMYSRERLRSVRSQAVTVDEVAHDLTVTPVLRMDTAAITDMFHDMAFVARRDGISVLGGLLESVDDELLRSAIKMAAVDQVEPRLVMKTLESDLKTSLRELESRGRMIIAGIEAIQMGRDAGEVAAITRQLARGVETARWEISDFVEESAAMKAVFEQIGRLQEGDSQVLIAGEDGTGRELIARTIHWGSARDAGRFAVVRCAMLPTDMMSITQRTEALSQLFGHRREAFIGADDDRDGLIVQAHGGSLFFVEIGLLPMPLQTHLLRVLTNQQVTPIGADEGEQVDVRVFASTSMDLEAQIEAGAFHRELYDYLAGEVIAVPPLRERTEDIPPLARRFADEQGEKLGYSSVSLSEEVVTRLQVYGCPGNVNELRRIIEEALLKSGGHEIRVEHLNLAPSEDDREMQIAHDMLQSLMPSAPPAVPGLDIAGKWTPARQVGGDHFSFFQHDGTLIVSIAAVAGRVMRATVPAVMFSGVLRTQMEAPATLNDRFASLNRSLYRSLDRRTFVCLTMGDIDPAAGVLRLANSGCPYPLHFHDGRIDEVSLNGYPLGIRPDAEYETVDLNLAPGDYIVFVSDGIPEALNDDEEAFGFERMRDVVQRRCSEGVSAAELIDALFTHTNEFRGGATQSDDMTCVAVRVEPQGP